MGFEYKGKWHMIHSEKDLPKECEHVLAMAYNPILNKYESCLGYVQYDFYGEEYEWVLSSSICDRNRVVAWTEKPEMTIDELNYR